MYCPVKFNIVWNELCKRRSIDSVLRLAEQVYFLSDDTLYRCTDYVDETPFDLEAFLFSDEIVSYILSKNRAWPIAFLKKHPRFIKNLSMTHFGIHKLVELGGCIEHLTNEQLQQVDWGWEFIHAKEIPEDLCKRLCAADNILSPDLVQCCRELVSSNKISVQIDKVDVCPICLKYFDRSMNTDDDDVEDESDYEFIRTVCKHIFHKKCWRDLATCPVCRFVF
jgi:hypothetical protein